MTYDDLNDDLSDMLGGTVKTATRPVTPPPSYTPPTYTEPCPKCSGTGYWRPGYPCFKCKGTAKLTFATPPDQRAKARVQANARSVKKKVEAAMDKRAWREENAAELKWLAKAADRQHELAHKGRNVWNFPIDLAESLAKYGTLTDGQLGAIRKCMQKDLERKAAADERKANAPTIDVSKIEEAFARARGDAARDNEGVKWLKLRLDTFTFSDAPARGPWPASIFVKEGDLKLGRISGGRFTRSNACTDDHEARIVAAAADPAAAAKTYGQRTGTCAVCGRELTNEESRERSIGPICARKYGW